MSAPLTIDQIMAQFKAALDTYAQGISAQSSIALDEFNVFDLLRQNTQGYLLVLHWRGDENIAEVKMEAMTLLYHKISAIISFNLGMTANPGGALINTVGTRPPLFQYVDNLRNTILGLQFDPDVTYGNFEYLGTEPVVTPEGMPMAEYQLNFVLRALTAQPSTNSTLPVS